MVNVEKAEDCTVIELAENEIVPIFIENCKLARD